MRWRLDSRRVDSDNTHCEACVAWLAQSTVVVFTLTVGPEP